MQKRYQKSYFIKNIKNIRKIEKKNINIIYNLGREILKNIKEYIKKKDIIQQYINHNIEKYINKNKQFHQIK